MARTARDEKLYNVVIEIYKKMYSETTPPADWDEMVKSGEVIRQGFFNNYVLDQARSNEIIDQTIKKYKWIKKHEAKKIETTVHFGCSPRFTPIEKDNNE